MIAPCAYYWRPESKGNSKAPCFATTTFCILSQCFGALLVALA